MHSPPLKTMTSYGRCATVWWRAPLVLLCAALLTSTACRGGSLDSDGDETVTEISDPDCVTNKEFFSQKVWKPVLEQRCFSCHNSSGQAKYSEFVLQPSS